MKHFFAVLLIILFSPTLIAQIIFEDDFESGNFKSEWNPIPGANVGMVSIENSVNNNDIAHSGNYGVFLGQNSNQENDINRLDLHLDLSGYTEVELSFWIKNLKDYAHITPGIYLSDDGGLHFTRVYPFNDNLRRWTYGQFPPFDIDQLAANANLTLSDQFIIRFQSGTENNGITSFTSHFAIDDVMVRVSPYVYADLPLKDGFEGNSLADHWAWVHSSPIGGTSIGTSINGRVEIISNGEPEYSPSASSGSNGLLLGIRAVESRLVNAVDLHLNLLGKSNVDLTFWIANFEDEDDVNIEDGIYFSDDGGKTFVKVYNFRLDEWGKPFGQSPPLHINILAEKAGLTLTDKFIVRFQQRSTDGIGQANFDGIVIDDVEVREVPTSYATLPVLEDFEGGSLENHWVHRNPALYGPTSAIEYTSPSGIVGLISDSIGNLSSPVHSGNGALVLGRLQNQNAADQIDVAIDLLLNLSGEPEVEMSFWTHFSEVDFCYKRQLELFFSNDGGNSFVKAVDLNLSINSNQTYRPSYTLDIDELAASVGLEFTSQFVIRFQQSACNNFSSPIWVKRLLIDDIEVRRSKTKPVIPPLDDSFESGELDNHWVRSYPNLVGATAHFDKVSSITFTAPIKDSLGPINPVAYHGDYALAIGVRERTPRMTSAVDLHVNLSGLTQAVLRFWLYTLEDDEYPLHHIFFSNDNGKSFVKVNNLNPKDYFNQYQQVVLDIDSLATIHGILTPNQPFSDDFIIRFQTYGSDPIDDAILIDQVQVFDPANPPKITGPSLITTFPNPTGDIVNLSQFIDVNQIYTIKILDPTGSVLFETSFTPTSIVFNYPLSLAFLPKGIYFLVIQSPNDFAIRKVVRQ